MRKVLQRKDVGKKLFYWGMFAPLIAQFLVFYVYINISSFTLGFLNEDNSFAGFKNFIKVFNDIKESLYLKPAIFNSLELFGWTMIFGTMLAVFFSYYIYKEHPGSMAFKIILYLPHIISNVVFVIMYRFFVDLAIPQFFEKVLGVVLYEDGSGFLSNPATNRATVLIFSIWVSFGTQVLMYTSAMSGISPSVIESGELDGITPLKELIFIVIPSIWNTFVTFIVVSIVGLFTNQMSLYTFYNVNADYSLYTLGYYLYVATLRPEMYNITYNYLSAMGLIMTVIAIPITLGTRWALEKFGPKTV